MKVLVVGATGGTGRATVAALVAEGHEVTALARSASSLTGPGVCGVDGDATDPAVVDRRSRTFASTRGEIRRMRVSREQVGRFLAQAVASDEFVGATVSLSTEAAA